jgi:hypothetical protein
MVRPFTTIFGRRPAKTPKSLIIYRHRVGRAEHLAVEAPRQLKISNGYGDMVQSANSRSSQLAEGSPQPNSIYAGGESEPDGLIAYYD